MLGHLLFLAAEGNKCHHWLERNLQTAMNGVNIYTGIYPVLTLFHALGGVICLPAPSMSPVLVSPQHVFQLLWLGAEFRASGYTWPCVRLITSL